MTTTTTYRRCLITAHMARYPEKMFFTVLVGEFSDEHPIRFHMTKRIAESEEIKTLGEALAYAKTFGFGCAIINW